MAITDPIADMFTRLRNALLAGHDEVIVPFSNLKLSISKILKDEGFIKYYEMISEDLNKKNIKIGLKYRTNGKPAISGINRISRPGKRYYVSKRDIPKVLNGFGISILSTSKGLMTGRNARLKNTGGELLGEVY